MTIEVRITDQPITVETVDGKVRVRPGPATRPDATITAPPAVALGLLMGELDLDGAVARGLEFQGDPEAFRRLQPNA